VSRATARVRDARLADLDRLLSWWKLVHDEGEHVGPVAPAQPDARFRDRLAALLGNPRHHILVAEADDQLVGVAVVTHDVLSPVSDLETAQVSFLHVRGGARQRGAGRALLAAVADRAAARGSDYVTVTAPPHARDATRFFARLGFSPLVVRRVARTTVLQQRLSGQSTAGRRETLRRRVAERRQLQRAAG
jgi:GNAT superfamily N-acetyltransferase